MTTQEATGTPASRGFAMPAEWDAHERCLMAWPVRRELWRDRLDEAKADYATVARAILGFEPLTMVCHPGDEAEVRNLCGGDVDILAAPIDDSWMRDSGPVFVRNDRGEIALVNFEFNAWGKRWHPFDSDNRIPAAVAAHLGVPMFSSPMVLEGGAYFVDGEGTLITTEQCLLDPNRNPTMSREQIEQGLRDYLGVSTVVWLPHGHSLDVGPEGTDGHVDGIAQYVAPGHVLLEVPASPDSSEYVFGQQNAKVLDDAWDAAGRALQATHLDPGPGESPCYCNFYLANGGVIVPVTGTGRDDAALELISSLYPGREVVPVPGETLEYGGGGPHCITQQVPVGDPASL
jgi:agmatine deiminase